MPALHSRRVIEKPRSSILLIGDTARKHYHDAYAAKAEIGWYRQAEGFCPRLIDADPDAGVLVIERLPVAAERPDYQPADALAELLTELARRRIHHRDVHPGNIVAGSHGPLLIDWETATRAAAPSYDLYGPEVSGLPIPDIHAALNSGYVMFWGSEHRMSIRNRWRTDAPVPPAPK